MLWCIVWCFLGPCKSAGARTTGRFCLLKLAARVWRSVGSLAHRRAAQLPLKCAKKQCVDSCRWILARDGATDAAGVAPQNCSLLQVWKSDKGKRRDGACGAARCCRARRPGWTCSLRRLTGLCELVRQPRGGASSRPRFKLTFLPYFRELIPWRNGAQARCGRRRTDLDMRHMYAGQCRPPEHLCGLRVVAREQQPRPATRCARLGAAGGAGPGSQALPCSRCTDIPAQPAVATPAAFARSAPCEWWWCWGRGPLAARRTGVDDGTFDSGRDHRQSDQGVTVPGADTASCLATWGTGVGADRVER
jgi:hypothetical protein